MAFFSFAMILVWLYSRVEVCVCVIQYFTKYIWKSSLKYLVSDWLLAITNKSTIQPHEADMSRHATQTLTHLFAHSVACQFRLICKKQITCSFPLPITLIDNRWCQKMFKMSLKCLIFSLQFWTFYAVPSVISYPGCQRFSKRRAANAVRRGERERGGGEREVRKPLIACDSWLIYYCTNRFGRQ